MKFNIWFRGYVKVEASSEDEAQEKFNYLNNDEFMKNLYLEEIERTEENDEKTNN